MSVQRYKGTRDLSPEQMARFRLIEAAFRESCLSWGYDEVRTPTIEYLHLFTSAGTLTPSMLGRVYSFLDWDGWSGERVVLRPDGTIPAARYYLENLADRDLVKLFYVTNVFMFEETGREAREKWQCGVELLGMRPPLAEAELVVIALEVLKHLGIGDIELRLSHAGLLRALLARLGLDLEEQHRLFDQVLDGDVQALTRQRPERAEMANALSLLLELKGKSAGFLKNSRALLRQSLPELGPALDDFIGVVESLETLKCGYLVDVASGRGFEYYTGAIFQLYCGERKVGGGGRYDELVPLMGGRQVPASGFALYVDALMDLVGLPPANDRRVLVRVGEGSLAAAFAAVGSLHQAGFVAEICPEGASATGWRWLLDVGAAELPFRLTDQASGAQSGAQGIAEVLALLRRKP